METPGARSELEAALAAKWDVDTLAVYADHLQAEGDPRGEIIALDLEIEARGNNVELAKRRTSLLMAWLGGLVPVDNVHASWVGDSLKFGFVENLELDGNDPNAVARFSQVLASPCGPYLRGLRMSGNAKELEEAFGVLAQTEHVWLSRLSIGLWNPVPAVSEPVWRAAFAAMPHLDSLELRPHAAFGPFSHATVKKLAIRGAAVYTALGEGARFDAVTDLELDLTANDFPAPYYDDEYIVEEPVQVQQALPKIAFPALRRLDLSQIGIARIDAAYQFLRTFDTRAHITHLKIPQLRNAADRGELVGAIHDMAALEVIEVAHGHYYEPPDLPNVRFVRAEPWRWPTQELASGKGLRIFMPGMKFGDTVTILDAVYLMEAQFEQLPAPAKRAWSDFWACVATIKKEPVAFSARALADAVEAVPSLMQNGWRELREELSARRPLSIDATVRIERCRS